MVDFLGAKRSSLICLLISFILLSFSGGNADAAIGDQLKSITPIPQGDGRAIAFDPATGRLFYTLADSTAIFITDADNNPNLPIDPGVVCGALSWDAKRNQLWCGSYDGSGMIYTINPVTGAKALAFTVTTKDSCYGPEADNFIDGLAYDEGPTSADDDDSLWLSGDGARTLYHVKLTGDTIDSPFTVPNNPRSDSPGCNSGIAVYGDFLWLALQSGPGQQPHDIVQVAKTDPTTVLSHFPFSSVDVPGPEGLALDLVTVPGKRTLWSNQFGTPLQLKLWDITPECHPPEQGEQVVGNISVQRNVCNTVALTRSSVQAEPVAANNGKEVLYIGNTDSAVYISRSSDFGQTWTEETPLPPGPDGFPVPGRDPDVVYHPDLKTTFFSFLYTNSNGTEGVVMIFVRRDTVANGNNCAVFFHPGTRISPDYPHLGVSNTFLYLTTNNIDTKGTPDQSDDTWVSSSVVRIKAADLANCNLPPDLDIFPFSGEPMDQKIFVPVENATDTMYWGAVDSTQSSSTFTIYRWRESDDSSQVDQITHDGLDGANLETDPVCAGGLGVLDWGAGTITRLAGRIGRGLRGAVGGGKLMFLWPVGSDEEHPQGHIHAVLLLESDLQVIAAQPHVFDKDTCMGFPVVGGNSDGRFGLSLVRGGNSIGILHSPFLPCLFNMDSTCAARGYVSVADESTDFHFTHFALTADGTHNPGPKIIPPNKGDIPPFGDYFTVRQNQNCPQTWVATNYSLYGGNTLPSHVNARYIEFGSSQQDQCPSPIAR